MENEPSTLSKTWRIFSSITGAIGLVSIAEDFKQLGPFLTSLLHAYRKIFHWPFRLLPFEIPSPIADYLIIGLIMILAIARASMIIEKTSFIGAIGMWALPMLLLGPLFLPFMVVFYLFDRKGRAPAAILEQKLIATSFLIAFIILVADLVIF